MQRTRSILLPSRVLTFSLLAAFGVACDEEAPVRDDRDADVADAATAAPDGGADGGADGPANEDAVYAMARTVHTEESRVSTIAFHRDLHDIDVDALAKGREFPGVSGFEVIAGKILVSSGEAPTITSFEVTDGLGWKDGATISFGDYGLSDNANWFWQYVIDDERVMLPFDGPGRILWNPRSMTITGAYTDSMLPLEIDGRGVFNDGGNLSGTALLPSAIMQPFYTWGGPDEQYGPSSYVVIYDEELTEKEIVEIPCPDLETMTQAEDGTTYFSNAWHSGLFALFEGRLGPCVARIKPDGTLDETFTTDFRDLTGGRYTQNFSYLRDGLAIANVLHHDESDIDFSGDYSPELEYKLLDGGYMRAWLFDLEEHTAKPIEGIDVPLTQRPNTAVIDGRIFLLAVDPTFASTRVFEISEDAVATKLFDVTGDLSGWRRLR
jgi:hypothetical protein